MLRLYYEDYDLSYELILIIIEKDKIYQSDLKYVINQYGAILDEIDVNGHGFVDLLQTLHACHVKLAISITPVLGNRLKTAQTFLENAVDWSKTYNQYFIELSQVCDRIVDVFVSTSQGPKLYQQLLLLKNQNVRGLSYVELLSKPKKRLETIIDNLRRISQHAVSEEKEIWEKTLEILTEILLEAKDVVKTLPSEPVINWKRYEIKNNKAKTSTDGTKLYQAILRKVCQDEIKYQSTLEKFLRSYADLLTVEIGGSMVDDFLTLVGDIFDLHWEFSTLLSHRTELKPSVNVFHQILTQKSGKFTLLYVAYFGQVVQLAMDVIRCFTTRPLLYEKLLRARNEDEFWESYTYLLTQPKIRLQELEEDLGHLVLLFNEQSARPTFIQCLIEVRGILKVANPPLQETLASPNKEQVKRRAKEVKKISKRKLNHSVYEIQTGLVKRHRFRSVTSFVTNTVNLDKGKAMLGVTLD